MFKDIFLISKLYKKFGEWIFSVTNDSAKSSLVHRFRMSIVNRIKNYIRELDKNNDEVVQRTMYNEYFFLLNITLFYPSLKSVPVAIVHIVQMLLYITLFILHIIITLNAAIYSNGDFLLMVHSLHICFLLVIMFSITIAANILRPNITLLLKMVGNRFYTYENEIITDEETQIKRKYIRIKRNLKIFFPVITIICGITTLIIAPLLNQVITSEDRGVYNEKGVNLLLPLNGWYPFDTSEGKLYWLAFGGQAISSTLLIGTLISSTWIYISNVLHIITQFQVLILSVKNITKRAMTNYLNVRPLEENYRTRPNFEDMEFQKQMVFCLKQNIKHHQEIIRAVHLFKETLKFPVFVVFLAGALILALSAIILVTANARPATVAITLSNAFAEIAHVTALCKSGQIVTDLNEQLHFELYNIPWCYCSKDFKKCLNIAQTRTVTGMTIKTLFNFKIDMDTYSQLLNTAYSYFSLLLAFKNS